MIEVIPDYPRNRSHLVSHQILSFGNFGVLQDDAQITILVSVLLYRLANQSSISLGVYSEGTLKGLDIEIKDGDTFQSLQERDFSRNDSEGDFQIIVAPGDCDVDQVKSFEVVFQLSDDQLKIIYDSNLFREETISAWGERIKSFAAQMMSAPATPVAELDLFLPGEQDTVLHSWNPSPESSAPYYRQRAYPGEFESQVLKTPERIAVADADKEWTYQQLNSFANAVAHRLLANGLKVNERVGIHVHRSVEMLGAMLGIMKAGGGYVPLEPGLPDDRIAYMAEDSGIKQAVSQKEFQGMSLFGETLETIWLEDISTEGDHPNPDRRCEPNDLIYVIYTSGSTGKPKGMEIEHHSMVNYVYANIERHDITEDDVYLASTTIAFDVSIPELFCPLVLGGKVYVAPAKIAADGETLGDLIEKAKITKMNATPTTFQILVASGWTGKSDLVIMSGGEAISPELANKLNGMCEAVFNEYGPCEATVFNTVHRIDNESGSVPLGTPLLNSRLYVLDENERPVLPLVRGRIFIGGDCVVRGYIDRPELNVEKFRVDPFSKIEGARMYDTGDVGYWNNGVLYYLGRSDNQVKIRGYRIELGEIENEISAHPDVNEVAVMVREDQPGQKKIVAYTQPVNEMPEDEVLQEFLLETLPPYMVPSQFVEMESFPKTVSGKIDQRSLPAPGDQVEPGPVKKSQGSANQLAFDIAEMWRDILKVKKVDPTDVLFRLGADSINAVQFQKKLTEYLGEKVPIASIFEAPTAQDLANNLIEKSPSRRYVAKRRNDVGGDIAVIGMAGRFPGAPNLDAYWENLVNEVESIQTFSNEELKAFGVIAADFLSPDYVPRGISLEGAYDFDPAFFDLSSAEAEVMDPQARLFLKTVWETLEDAGYVTEPDGVRIGVYAGGGYPTYQFAHLGLQSVDRLTSLTGNASDYIATRSAYTFGLTGPAVSVQTACSTSLVAVNEACEAIRAGRCEMAIAGGVSFSYPHEQGYHYDKGLIYSKDGHCRPFDAEASGTIFSHGAGAVLLKPLDQAVADGDQIHGVIRGIAINNDGNRKGAFAAPSINGQSTVIQSALADAGISPDEITYVEAHGTGTVIGDPIEITGLTRAWRLSSERKQDCPIGSVKSNIGHADAAAGIAGLLKLLLSLKNRTLPATLNFEKENPEMNLENTPFYIKSETTPWDTDKLPRTGAVSAMGLGGTNAHAIVSEAPLSDRKDDPSDEYVIVPFSAKRRKSLEGAVLKWKDFANQKEFSIQDAAFTMQHGRKSFDYRAAIVAKSRVGFINALEDLEVGSPQARVINREPVFMFTGQGSQYHEMALASYENDEVFRDAIDECGDVLKDCCGLDLKALLFSGNADLINETQHAQPALFAIGYAQSRRWMDWGFSPVALIGHSIGEYLAATLSGVMSLRDALNIVATRGRLMQQMKPGEMLAVMNSAEEVDALIDKKSKVEIAAINSPALTVVSGSGKQIDAFIEVLNANEIRFKKLVASHAFHSRMMEPMLQEFKDEVAKIKLIAPKIPYISNVSGTWITDQEAISPDYYAEQVRSAVRFREGIETIAEEGAKLFIEMGPGRVLTTFANDVLAGTDHVALSTLPGPGEDTDSKLFSWKALASTWMKGQTLDWPLILPVENRHRISLPTYQFDEKTYRIESNIEKGDSVPGAKSIFNTPIWKESKSGFAGVTITPGDKTVWLCLISPKSSLDKGIVQATGGALNRQIVVRMGKSYKRSSAISYRIDPSSEGDYEMLVQSVLNDFGTIGGVIHTWSCANPTVKNDDKVLKNQDSRSLSALWLGKALGGVGNRNPIPVNFITRGLIRGKGCKLYPGNCALAGVVGVIQREYPNLITRTIDLGDGKFDIRTEESIKKVLNGDRHHLKLAMKDGSWWLPTFENDDPDLVDRLNPLREIKSGGVYVITGGLGGLARNIAKDMSSRMGNLTFVLVSRTGFPPRKEWESVLADPDAAAKMKARIEDLIVIEQNECRIQIVTADLSEPGLMEATLNAVNCQHEAIDGVIHTAGVLRDGAIAMKDKRSVEEVFSSKAIPAQGMFDYFKSPDHNTDFVVFFSSVSTELAAFGQSDYAAANAYLDGLAEMAFATGLPFFSVSWPAWRDIGMAAETSADAAEASGLSSELIKNSISPDQGAQAFFDIISYADCPRTVVSVLHFDDHYQRFLAARQPRDHRNEESLTRVEAPIEQMISIWKRELKAESIAEDDDYFDLGGDSLFAVKLLSRIQETFGQSIPMSLLIKAPTPKLLVQAMGLNADVEVVLHEGLPDHILPLRIEKDSDGTPMFCIHGADGSVMFYQGFANQLEKGRSIYGIESRHFYDESYKIEANIDAMAERYLNDIKEIRPEGPYIFAGYSFGALVAQRMAQLAEEWGDQVEGLVIYDMFNPEFIRPYSFFERIKVIWDKRSIFPFWPRVRSTLVRCGELMKWSGIHAVDWCKYKFGRISGEYAKHVEARYMNESLIPEFHPTRYEGNTLLVLTEDPGDKYDFGDLHGWRNILTGRLTHRFVTGNHLEVFTGRHLSILVNHTNYFLKGAPKKKYSTEPVQDTQSGSQNERPRRQKELVE